MASLMACSQKTRVSKIQTASLRLGNGWSGRAVLSDSDDRKFQKDEWIKCLSQPDLLFENVEKVLKTEGRNCVAVTNLTVGDSRLKVVIKRHCPETGLRQFFRSFRRGRALRNFDATLKLLKCDIPAAAPLAALHKRRCFLIEQSIYIAGCLEESFDLRTFCRQRLSNEFQLRKQLSNQLAAILAALHKNDLWHRDSKATNFIVSKDTEGVYKVLLTDVDGIKPYFLHSENRRFRCLWQLAASLLSVPAVNRTDYLRTFTAYSNLTGLDSSLRRGIFRRLTNKAKAKYLRYSHKRILIIKPSSLGDIVQALPALSALRSSFPQARISWFVRTEFAPLIENHPHLTETILFDRKYLGKAWFNPRAFASLLSLIRQLRRSKFDVVLDLQGLFRTASLAWLSGCRKRLGMASAREFGHIFYTHKIAQDRDSIHLVDYYLKIARVAGASDISAEFILNINFAAAYSVRHLLTKHKINPDNFAVLVPGSAHADKCWPVERFAALAEKISSEFGLSIVATGTKAEWGVVEDLRKKTAVAVANLAGATSLTELAALIKTAKLVVSNDTGPGHIAAALGVPVVLIFGRSNPARVAPYGRTQCAVAVEPTGRGFKADSYDPKHNIRHISVDEVFEKVCEQLTPV